MNCQRCGGNFAMDSLNPDGYCGSCSRIVPIEIEAAMRIRHDEERGAAIGMTLRDYFAAATLMPCPFSGPISQPEAELATRNAYVIADAMLRARQT